MRIVLLGATGRTGERLLTQALGLGHEVTVLARKPSRLPRRLYQPLKGGSTSSRLRVVRGDVRDRAALADAFGRQEAVLSALGGRVASEGWVRAEGMGAVRDVMHAGGVRRLVALSAFGAGETRDRGPYCRWIRRLIPREYEDTERMETIVQGSGLDWLLVRPTLLTRRGLTREYRVDEELRVGWFPRVPRADVAHFMLGQLSGDRWLRRAPGLTGA